MSWAKFVSKSKSHENQKCVNVVSTMQRKRKAWSTLRTEQTWQKYLKTTKKKIIARKKKPNFVKFLNLLSIRRQILTFNCLSEEQKSQVKRNIQDFNFDRKKRNRNHSRNNRRFRVQDEDFASSLFFKHDKDEFVWFACVIYRSTVEKTKTRIQKNEIKQMIKRCKSNNILEFDDISNRILKILCTELMFLSMNLFRICVELNYHSRCFKIAHIIAFKKFNKKDYFDVKTYKFITLLNTLNKILKSIIIWRINNLTKTHDMFFASQMSDRKNRSCETTLKLLIEQIHTM